MSDSVIGGLVVAGIALAFGVAMARRTRCSSCNRYFARKRTGVGRTEGVGTANRHCFEVECRYCGFREWIDEPLGNTDDG